METQSEQTEILLHPMVIIIIIATVLYRFYNKWLSEYRFYCTLTLYRNRWCVDLTWKIGFCWRWRRFYDHKIPSRLASCSLVSNDDLNINLSVSLSLTINSYACKSKLFSHIVYISHLEKIRFWNTNKISNKLHNLTRLIRFLNTVMRLILKMLFKRPNYENKVNYSGSKARVKY